MTSVRVTRAEQKVRIRADIRQAAMDLFETRGFEGATIDDIAAAAGIGRRTFFRYFSCKEAVLFSGGVYQNLATALQRELARGTPPARALLTCIERDTYGSQEPDAATIRRRHLRRSLLQEPSVAAFYRTQIAEMARSVTAVLQQDPHASRIRFLPELLGGLMHTMTLEHLESGKTHHFAVDADAWRTALRALEKSFDAA